MLPVQNLSKVCASRIVGVQGIAKAELIGAWAQLKSAEPRLRAGSNVVFVGFLDNEGMVKTLRQAQTMSHRDLHRARQGNLYLREIKALMQEFGARVQWGWLKAHTDRKGWFYERATINVTMWRVWWRRMQTYHRQGLWNGTGTIF